MSFDLKHIIPLCIDLNRQSQQQLYEYTYKRLVTAVALYTKDNSEKDWVFNLGMLNVFKSLDNYKIGTNYLAWARTILIRSAIDHIRRNKKYRTHIAPIELDVNNTELTVFNDALNLLNTESLISIIQALPEKERIIFTMYEIDGYSHVEIEEIIGINKNTSKWLLSKARKSLRAKASILLNLKNISHEK